MIGPRLHRGELLALLLVAVLLYGPGCYLTARGGRELNPTLFLPGLVLMVVGLRAFMNRSFGLPAWRRFFDGMWIAVFVLLG